MSASLIEELSSAIIQNDVELVKTKLGEGSFEVNIPNSEGELLLNKAIKSNRLIIGYFLLEAGAMPETLDREGVSALTLVEGHVQEGEWLALFNKEKLSEEGANAAIFQVLTDAKPETETKFLPIVETYLKLGANIDGRNAGKFTYLMEASSRRLLGMVRLLCSHPDIDPNVKVERGRGRRKQTFTALSLSKNFPKIQDELRKCGAVE